MSHSKQGEDTSGAEAFIVTILAIVGVCLLLVHPALFILYAVVIGFVIADA